jgi:hypothetical protein
MSTATVNSLSSVLQEFHIQFNNSLEIIKSLSKVVDSNSDFIEIDIKTPTGVIEKIKLPTISKLKDSIDLINANLESLSGLDQTGEAFFLNKNGEFRKIFKSKLKTNPISLSGLQAPKRFSARDNFFLENLLNPLLYININLTNIIERDVKSVLVRKYILKNNDNQRNSIFDSNLAGRNDINISQFLDILNEGNIEYVVDDEIINLEPANLKYKGSFSVLRIYETEEVINIDNTIETVQVRKYQLDKLTYSDVTLPTTDTQTLKIGDSLYVNRGSKNTLYRIRSIDTSTNSVTLSLVEGFDVISIGANELCYYSESNFETNLQVPIGIDERIGLFIKPISSTNILADDWSNGIYFYSSNLVIVSNIGEITLSDFYKNYVIDFGNAIKNIGEQRLIPLELGIVPDPPILNASNFKTIIINNHLLSKNKIEDLKKLQSEKNRIISELNELSQSISTKRQFILTNKYQNLTLKQNDEIELNRLLKIKDEKNITLRSLISEISGVELNESEISIKPKYRIHGFWSTPIPKQSDLSHPQEVVQYEVQYRYISNSGQGNQVETFNIENSITGQVETASRSSWVTVKTELRQRELNVTTGLWEWKSEDINDSNRTNSNEIEIPITPGELVEIRARSISEVGYPVSPLVSAWSDIIQIPFDVNILLDDPISVILSQNKEDLSTLKLQMELENQGIIQHVKDSFSSNENYWAHEGKNLASGFLSNEQKPISVFDKFVQLETEISQLRSIVAAIETPLIFKLLDENGNIITIQQNNINKIFAGYYNQQVQNKGQIVRKVYYIIIENPNTIPVYLQNLLPGEFKSTQTQYTYPVLDLSKSTNLGNLQYFNQLVYFRNTSIQNSNTLYTTPFTIANPNLYINDSSPNATNDILALSTRMRHHSTVAANAASRTFLNSINQNLTSFKSNQLGVSINNNISTRPNIVILNEYERLIGEDSTGASLYPIINSHDDLYAGGTTLQSYREIKHGYDNAIKIPIVFEYRLSDFSGASIEGIGNIMGGPTLTNAKLKRSIGVDFKTKNGQDLKFDLEFEVSYKSDGATLSNVPNRDFETILGKIITRNLQ